MAGKIHPPENSPFFGLQRDYFSREYIFQPVIFRGDLSFQGSTNLREDFLSKGEKVPANDVCFAVFGIFLHLSNEQVLVV